MALDLSGSDPVRGLRPRTTSLVARKRSAPWVTVCAGCYAHRYNDLLGEHSVAENGSDDRELFDHLEVEFGDRGRDAVEFLETAQRLVAGDVVLELPAVAGAAAYCVREALKRLLPRESGRPSWRKLSDDVLDAKKRFEAVRGLPGADEAGALQDLLSAIAGLEDFKRNEQGQHQRRLAELIEGRTGAPPLAVTLREYQRLLREIDDDAVHGSASLEQVRELLDRALSLLKTVFAPFQLRRVELEALAQLPSPGEEDVQRLLPLCATPHHLSYFMQHAVVPRWLSLLAPHGILDPPQGGGVWPVLFLVERLSPTHEQEVAAWLEEMYVTWGANEVGAAYMAAAARECVPAASATLLRALRDYPRSHWIRAQAARALEVMGEGSPFTEAVADVLLDPDDEVALAGVARRTIEALLDGMSPDNADARIVLLARKLSRSAETRYLLFSVTPSGSIEDVAEEEARGTGVLLRGVIAAVRRARQLGVPTDRILAFLEPIPSALLSRLRAWALSEATDVPPEALVAEIANAIRDRNPTGDDAQLIRRITRDVSTDLYADAWRSAMGSPPMPEGVGQALASHEVPRDWQRAQLWHPLLPEVVREAWDTTVTLMSAVLHAPSREDYLEPPSRPELVSAQSPMRRSELEGLDVADAARRISSWRPTGDHMIIARELARTLEELVSSEPRTWANRPLEMLALLRHATYVHHYFQGLARTSGDLSGLGPQLVEAIAFARTHPWDPVPLGDDDFDYDPTWAPADEAGVRLIGRLAERDVDLGDRYDDAWRMVLAAARDRSSGSSVSPREDPLETAINRPCTRALEDMFHLVATEFRRSGAVRQEALDFLDETLDLEGWNGAEHRAIIAPRLPFLLHVAREWVESRESKIFGDEAPDDLGQRTVDLALKWGRPNRWLLERHRRAVLRAVRAGSENALDHALVAMLWEVPGHSIEETLRALVPMGASILSNAGERLARLLMREAEPEHVDRGALFWEKTLEDRSLPREAFQGFGWWAEVEALNTERWERMTLATCERAEGSLDWCVQVAERCVREPITAAGLGILARLLRGRHEPWDRSQLAEVALGALKASSSESTVSEARQRLRAALTDLGYFEAADL